MKKSKKKIILTVIALVIVLIVGAFGLFSASIYDQNINQRYESYKPLMLKVEDFEGLEATAYKFPSDKGQILVGDMYKAGDKQKGIIIFAHGFGDGGYNSYLDSINYFAQNGYYVFAYDATANDESQGEWVGGFPQGAIDLDYAISFVEDSGNFPNLPIGLFGHSWGAYSVSSVLSYHPEIKAVIACCGANKSSDYFEAVGKKEAGDFIYTMMPFVKLHERIKFGKYATNTAIDGFESSNAKVLIAHSEDDQIVPIYYGYNLFFEKYKDNPRFTFMHFEDRGHDNFFVDPNNTYKVELAQIIEKWAETLSYDFKTEENKEKFAKDKADFIEANLDRQSWANTLDLQLFERFLDFYDDNLISN